MRIHNSAMGEIDLTGGLCRAGVATAVGVVGTSLGTGPRRPHQEQRSAVFLVSSTSVMLMLGTLSFLTVLPHWILDGDQLCSRRYSRPNISITAVS